MIPFRTDDDEVARIGAIETKMGFAGVDQASEIASTNQTGHTEHGSWGALPATLPALRLQRHHEYRSGSHPRSHPGAAP